MKRHRALPRLRVRPLHDGGLDGSARLLPGIGVAVEIGVRDDLVVAVGNFLNTTIAIMRRMGVRHRLAERIVLSHQTRQLSQRVGWVRLRLRERPDPAIELFRAAERPEGGGGLTHDHTPRCSGLTRPCGAPQPKDETADRRRLDLATPDPDTSAERPSPHLIRRTDAEKTET